MLKFIPQFSPWKLGPNTYLVVASCAKTHEVVIYTHDPTLGCHRMSQQSQMPDLRLFVPCKWAALPAVVRADFRDIFHQHLAYVYGDESLAPAGSLEWQTQCG